MIRSLLLSSLIFIGSNSKASPRSAFCQLRLATSRAYVPALLALLTIAPAHAKSRHYRCVAHSNDPSAGLVAEGDLQLGTDSKQTSHVRLVGLAPSGLFKKLFYLITNARTDFDFPEDMTAVTYDERSQEFRIHGTTTNGSRFEIVHTRNGNGGVFLSLREPDTSELTWKETAKCRFSLTKTP